MQRGYLPKILFRRLNIAVVTRLNFWLHSAKNLDAAPLNLRFWQMYPKFILREIMRYFTCEVIIWKSGIYTS